MNWFLSIVAAGVGFLLVTGRLRVTTRMDSLPEPLPWRCPACGGYARGADSHCACGAEAPPLERRKHAAVTIFAGESGG